jgi:uncharacterized protein
MKYLVLFGIIFAVIWWLKLSRQVSSSNTKPSETAAQNMVACMQCGLHLPENEAVKTAVGVYCSELHRRLKEG